MSQFISSTETIILSPAQSPQPYSIGLIDILLLGFLIQLIRFGLCIFKLHRIIKQASPWRKVGNIKILFSGQISSPFSTRALLQKHIILPYSLLDSPGNLRIAIRHEVQHHRNGDLYWVFLVEALKLFCFWNPAAYLWKNQIDCLQEYACDEALLQSKKTSLPEYGQCLLEIATYHDKTTLVACSNMVPKFSTFKKHNSQLKRRLSMISKIGFTKNSPVIKFIQTTVLSLGMITSTVFVYAQTENSDEVIINGIAISGRLATPENLLALEDEGYVEEIKGIYSKAQQQAETELPVESGESTGAYATRIGQEYVETLRLVAGLEVYAAGYERAYNRIEEENISLEERILFLEQENSRLLEQD